MTLADRIIRRLRKPITNHDTAEIPATAREEVEAILAARGPLALHEIVRWNRDERSVGLGKVWPPEALEAGLADLLTSEEVVTTGFTQDPAGEYVGLFALTPPPGTPMLGDTDGSE